MSPPDEAFDVESEVVAEDGRWVVYLLVTMWNGTAVEQPIETVRRRIGDYATRERAEVAASWMRRAAARERRTPPTGL
jgi:hypothetical protein